jgi:hypothetical protein
MWHVWGRRAAYRAWMGEPEGKRPPEENIGVDGREWILRKSVGRAQIGSSGSGQGLVGLL